MAMGDQVYCSEAPIDLDSPLLKDMDWIISYGYRHILKADLLNRFPGRVINLHISLLPWNRGADPNLWSFLEDTPKGVTIHLMDAGIDTGEILAQQEVFFGQEETLRSSYEKLSATIEQLFIEFWPEIRSEKLVPVPQGMGGTTHRMKDKLPFQHLLYKGWDTPVIDLTGKALPNTINHKGT